MIKWVARLSCGHIWGDETVDAPEPAEVHLCFACGEDRAVEDVVTNRPETVDGRAW